MFSDRFRRAAARPIVLDDCHRFVDCSDSEDFDDVLALNVHADTAEVWPSALEQAAADRPSKVVLTVLLSRNQEQAMFSRRARAFERLMHENLRAKRKHKDLIEFFGC